jgi:nitroreductase/FMN reductase (NADPH)/FMN reductase [NAD(P)H]
MNDVIKQLHERKSVRVFTEREISMEARNSILNAAFQAPTAGNQQLYTILDITDEALKKRLSETCDNQPFIAEAKMVLIFCADCQKWYDAFADVHCSPRKPGVGDLMLAVSDANIAAQNAVVAAHSLGIGSCYIGDILENAEVQRDILGLPPYVMPACMLVIGHPKQQQLSRTKPRRFELETVVFEDRYRTQEADEVTEAIAYKNEGRRETIDQFCARKWNSDFSREMTRSVRAWLSAYPFEG